MKTMKIIILLLVLPTFSFGQNLPSIVNESNFIPYKPNTKDNNIKGSIFLFEEWNNRLTLLGIDKKVYNFNSNTNYNVLTDEFIVRTNDTLYTLNDMNVDHISFKGLKFRKMNNGYFNLLTEGKLELLKKYSLLVNQSPVDPISKEKIGSDSYKLSSKFFYMKDKTNMLGFNLNKRSLLNLMDINKRKTIIKFSKERKLSFKKEKDVIKIINYYNSL